MIESFTMSRCEGIEVYTRKPIDVRNHIPSTTSAEKSLQQSIGWLRRINALNCQSEITVKPRSIESEQQIVLSYLKNIRHNSPAYFNDVSHIANELPPLDPNCRLAINLIAHHEADTVLNGLKQMLSHKRRELSQCNTSGVNLHPSLYDVTVLINGPYDDEETATRYQVEKFIKEEANEALKINCIDVRLPAHIANIGMARRLAHDITFVRSIQRTTQTGPLYISSEDADICSYDKYVFERFIKYLDTHPNKSAVRARTERDTKILSEIPYLFLNYRFSTQLVTILHSKEFQPDNNPNYDCRINSDVPEGYATAYVAADIALAGGFPITPRAENILMGEQLAAIRTLNSSLPRFDSVGRIFNQIHSSPRRTLAGYIRGVDPYAANNFNASSMSKLIEEPLEILIEHAKQKPIPQARQWLINNIETGFNKLLRTAPSLEIANQAMTRTLMMLGFENTDYSLIITDNAITCVIDLWGNVEARIARYQGAKL